jgi:hypothetical protein
MRRITNGREKAAVAYFYNYPFINMKRMTQWNMDGRCFRIFDSTEHFRDGLCITRLFTHCRCFLGSIPALYTGSSGYKFRPETVYDWSFSWFPLILHTTGQLSNIRLPHSFNSLISNYSVTQWYVTELLKASVNKRQINRLKIKFVVIYRENKYYIWINYTS